jgi:hypothetical protein
MKADSMGRMMSKLDAIEKSWHTSNPDSILVRSDP